MNNSAYDSSRRSRERFRNFVTILVLGAFLTIIVTGIVALVFESFTSIAIMVAAASFMTGFYLRDLDYHYGA